MRWIASGRADPRIVPLADRHYNRQKIGAAQFAPPGRCLVLRTEAYDAFWITSWPFAEYVQHAWAGAWMCSAFRNEGTERSSTLIEDAVAATAARWPTPPRIPAWAQVDATPRAVLVERVDVAMVTFVDASKTRRKRDPGRCYLRAGFERIGRTAGGLWALGLRTDRLPRARPALTVQASLFG